MKIKNTKSLRNSLIPTAIRKPLLLKSDAQIAILFIKGYKEEGKAFFVHDNRGRQPAITLLTDTKQLILDLYRTKYYDCSLTHFSELLAEKENIKVSDSTISSILRKEYILSLKANRSTNSAHNFCTRRLEIPHFSAACSTVI